MANSKIRDFRVKPQAAPVPEIGKRQMSMEHRAAAQEAILLINHHKTIASQIERGLVELLMQGYGIDITTGNWKLDFATGEMTQVQRAPEAGP